MKTTAVIPIRRLDDAKQRLAPQLDASARQALFEAMVQDVLTAVEACEYVDAILVVTNDDAVAALVAPFGVTILPEPAEPGLIAAVTHAARVLSNEGVANMLFLPGDVPMVTADELEAVLAGFAGDGQATMTIVPAADFGGSNCVVTHPPDCLAFQFGIDSYRKHIAAARDAGIEPVVVNLPGIGLDIDTPDDLAALIDALLKRGDDSHTLRCLQQHGILEKVTITDATTRTA